MPLNLRGDDSFVEDAGWQRARDRCPDEIRSRSFCLNGDTGETIAALK